jgi:nucleoside-diphosphate-sugar epimerase
MAAGAALEADGIPFFACDLSRDAKGLQAMVDGCDAVVHAAALSSPWGRRVEFVSANVHATRHVVDACDRAGVRRLVHISSPSVLFAFRAQPNLTEATQWQDPPANHYIATKREAEDIAQAAGAVILRPKALFGPGDTTLLPRLTRVARRGVFPIFGSDDPLLELTWIDDAVEAIRLALEAPSVTSGQIYHITSGMALARSVVLQTLLNACGLQVRYLRIPVGLGLALAGGAEALSRYLGGEPPLTRYGVAVLAFEQTLDIAAARRDLGFAPQTDIRAALTQCGQEWRSRKEAGK